MDLAEREIRTLEGLLTRQRVLRNQYVTDFARNANPLRSLKAPIAGSRARAAAPKGMGEKPRAVAANAEIRGHNLRIKCGDYHCGCGE
jgi:hypothetical protein